MSRFNLHYSHIVSYDLLFKDHFINVMQLPKLDHIVLNTGLGLKASIPSTIWTVLLGIESITNRRPLITRAKRSIDQYKVRQNNPLGCKLTLRRTNSFNFFHRLVHIVIPRLEDLSFLGKSLEREYSKDDNKALSERIRHNSNFISFARYYLPLTTSLLKFFLDNRIGRNHGQYYSFSFGLNDFFTSFSTDFDKFHASYGLDITLIIRYSNHSTLSHPFYFLSFFQMPL